MAALHNGLMPRSDKQSWTPYQFGKKEPEAFRKLREQVEQIKAKRSVKKKVYPKWATPTEEQQQRTKRRAAKI